MDMASCCRWRVVWLVDLEVALALFHACSIAIRLVSKEMLARERVMLLYSLLQIIGESSIQLSILIECKFKV